MERHSHDRPLNLRVDDIDVKVRLHSADCAVQNVRLSASSLYGAWLKPTCYLENLDPVTGVTTELCVLYEVGNAENVLHRCLRHVRRSESSPVVSDLPIPTTFFASLKSVCSVNGTNTETASTTMPCPCRRTSLYLKNRRIRWQTLSEQSSCRKQSIWFGCPHVANRRSFVALSW
jgi:hypothetical protein